MSNNRSFEELEKLVRRENRFKRKKPFRMEFNTTHLDVLADKLNQTHFFGGERVKRSDLIDLFYEDISLNNKQAQTAKIFDILSESKEGIVSDDIHKESFISDFVEQDKYDSGGLSYRKQATIGTIAGAIMLAGIAAMVKYPHPNNPIILMSMLALVPRLIPAFINGIMGVRLEKTVHKRAEQAYTNSVDKLAKDKQGLSDIANSFFERSNIVLTPDRRRANPLRIRPNTLG